jgi:hypothetical protein
MTHKTQRPRPEQQPAEQSPMPKTTGYTREDLRRDTYVPSRKEVSGSPRQHEFANRHADY